MIFGYPEFELWISIIRLMDIYKNIDVHNSNYH